MPSKISKRKREIASIVCILHASGIEKNDSDFTPLNRVKGSAESKLAKLHEIRDKRNKQRSN